MKKLSSYAFLLIGIAAVVFSIVMFSLDVGSYESNQYYGGDAYTGIQQAAAQSANNVQALAVIAKLGFGFVLLTAGLTLIALFLRASVSEPAEQPSVEPSTPQPPVQPVQPVQPTQPQPQPPVAPTYAPPMTPPTSTPPFGGFPQNPQ